MASCLLSSPRIHSPPDSLMRRTSVTKVSENRVLQQAAKIVVGPMRVSYPLDAKAVHLRSGVENLHTLGDDFGADAVSGDHRDRVGFHLARSSEGVQSGGKGYPNGRRHSPEADCNCLSGLINSQSVPPTRIIRPAISNAGVQPSLRARIGVKMGEAIPPMLPPQFIMPETVPACSFEMSIVVAQCELKAK